MVDSNWLLSTSAQSAAAIVGVIGGFLVSRALAITAQREALTARRAELDADAQRYANLEKAAGAALADYEANDFIWDVRRELIERQGNATLEQLSIETDTEIPAEEERVRLLFAEAVSAVRDSIAAINSNLESLPALPDNYADYVATTQDRGPTTDRWGIHQDVFDEILESRRPHDAFALTLPPALRDIAPRTARDEHADLRDDLREQTRKRVHAEEQLELVTQGLAGLSVPYALKVGVLVLIVFAIVGVLFPILLLPVEQLSSSLRRTVVALFVGGLALVLAYLVVAVIHWPQWLAKKLRV